MQPVTIVITVVIFIVVAVSYLAWVGSQLGAQLYLPQIAQYYSPLTAHLTPEGDFCYDIMLNYCTAYSRGSKQQRVIGFIPRTQLRGIATKELKGCFMINPASVSAATPRHMFVVGGTCPAGYSGQTLGYIATEPKLDSSIALKECTFNGRRIAVGGDVCTGPTLGYISATGQELARSYDLCGRRITKTQENNFESRRQRLQADRWCGSGWQNFPNIWDVNNDGTINDDDTKVVADKLAKDGEQAVPAITDTTLPPPFYDVDGDGKISNRDLMALTRGQAVPPPPAATSAWQNKNNRFDVNNDTKVTPFDALLIINDISKNGERELPAPTAEQKPPPYNDVNGDGSVSKADADEIVNHLRGR